MAATASSISLAVPAAASLASSRSSVAGVNVAGSNARVWTVRKPLSVSCVSETKAEQDESAVSRRSAVALIAGVGAVGIFRSSPALAAYGETANIFGAAKKDPGFVSYTGAGFSLSLPSKWNPSKEVEFPGQVLRYEDNFDQLSNMSVSILPTEKNSISDYGSPEAFLKSVSYLLGKQAYTGKTQSEGGFEVDSVASANVFKAEELMVKGKPYYYLVVLTRTGDGTEGGRHQYIVGTIAGGKLYLFKAQAGDKRWFKGTSKYVEGAASSFMVA